ncbi:sensor histidine kinase [Yinghuangia sp. YIM S09857]|uniref:sensor histidine kinase n=1 Tax=Yinghuangia sp. YIM S09857 TaxID=3436929 RepID=UPI003F536B64
MSGVPGSRTARWANGLRRSRREWRNDAALGAVALGLGVLLLLATISDDPDAGAHATPQVVLGAVAALSVTLFRRAHPTVLGVFFAVAGFLVVPVMGSAIASFFSVASFRRARTALLVVGLHVVLVLALFRMATVTWSEYWQAVGTFLFLDVVALTGGMLVRSLEARARQAENEQRLRVDEARHLERERIAREMHDVLAHRISLLAVHAGALEFRAGASPEEARAAGVIRQCAHDALEDLRDVIRMLRTDETSPGEDDAGESDRPQPTLADLPALIEQSRRAGAVVEFAFAPVGERGAAAQGPAAEEGVDRTDGTDPAAVPASLGRHAYRIVQEGLTNARKHALGEPVRVRVDTAGRSGLRIEIVNPLPTTLSAPGDPIPGAGAGLIGLAERVTLAGGRLEHGPGRGEFRLRAWLPWSP